MDALIDSHAQTASALNLLQLSRKNQYYTAFIVNLGALGLGTVIGWSSPTEQLVVKRINATDFEIAWISSIMTLGAASSQVVMALLLKLLSCKQLLIGMNTGLAISWVYVDKFVNFGPRNVYSRGPKIDSFLDSRVKILLACSTNVALFYAARFFTGFFAGTNCVSVPIFMGEISHKSMRGRMGIVFQLMLVLGILIMYSLGEFKSFFVMVIVPIVFPAVQIIPLFMLPESPVYYMNKGKTEGATNALRYFRGPDYEIESEMAEIVAYVNFRHEDTFFHIMKKWSSLNALLILVVLHFVQQLSGINAFMFYAANIFEKSGSSLSPGVSAIIMASVQVIVTAMAAVIVDKVGRRLLMVTSLTILATSNIVLGTYMVIAEHSQSNVENVQFLPVMVLSIYIIGFSLGAGPLPWALLGEMVPDRIKFVVNTGVACLNWILAFAVTASFKGLQNTIGTYTVFYLYGVVCIAGMLFVFFCVVETKNKTLEEVQIALSKKKGYQ